MSNIEVYEIKDETIPEVKLSTEERPKTQDELIKEDIEYDILLRQSLLLFPDVEKWILEMAVLAYFKNGKKDFVKPDEDKVEAIKRTYSNVAIQSTE